MASTDAAPGASASPAAVAPALSQPATPIIPGGLARPDAPQSVEETDFEHSFANMLTGEFDSVCEQAETGLAVLKRLKSFFERYAKLMEGFASSADELIMNELTKLAAKNAGDGMKTSINAARRVFQVFRDHTQDQKNFARTLRERVAQPLAEVHGLNTDSCKATILEHKGAKNMLEAQKSRMDRGHSKAIAALEALERAKNPEINLEAEEDEGAKGSRIRDKLGKMQKGLQKGMHKLVERSSALYDQFGPVKRQEQARYACADYQEQVNQSNFLLRSYLSYNEPTALDRLQVIEEHRITTTKRLLQALSVVSEDLCRSSTTLKAQLTEVADSIDVEKDVYGYVHKVLMKRQGKPLNFEFFHYDIEVTPEQLFQPIERVRSRSKVRSQTASSAGGASFGPGDLLAGTPTPFGISIQEVLDMERAKDGKPPLSPAHTSTSPDVDFLTGGDASAGSGSESESGSTQQDNELVPSLISSLTAALDRLGGFETEGIFRISASHGELRRLRRQFEQLQYDIPAGTDANVPAALLKAFLRELAEPLIPEQLYKRALAFGSRLKKQPSSSGPADAAVAEKLRKKQFQLFMASLPPVNRAVVRHVTELCIRVAAKSDVNKMGYNQLAIVFAPSFLRDPSVDRSDSSEVSAMQALMQNAQFEAGFLVYLMTHLSEHSPDGVAATQASAAAAPGPGFSMFGAVAASTQSPSATSSSLYAPNPSASAGGRRVSRGVPPPSMPPPSAPPSGPPKVAPPMPPAAEGDGLVDVDIQKSG